MGSSVGKMIFGKILVDIVFNVAIFGAVYAILQSRLFLSYKLNFALYALLIFFVLNSLLYLTLLKVDYKEVISDHQNEINKLIGIAEENLDIEVAQS